MRACFVIPARQAGSAFRARRMLLHAFRAGERPSPGCRVEGCCTLFLDTLHCSCLARTGASVLPAATHTCFAPLLVSLRWPGRVLWRCYLVHSMWDVNKSRCFEQREQHLPRAVALRIGHWEASSPWGASSVSTIRSNSSRLSIQVTAPPVEAKKKTGYADGRGLRAETPPGELDAAGVQGPVRPFEQGIAAGPPRAPPPRGAEAILSAAAQQQLRAALQDPIHQLMLLIQVSESDPPLRQYLLQLTHGCRLQLLPRLGHPWGRVLGLRRWGRRCCWCGRNLAHLRGGVG